MISARPVSIGPGTGIGEYGGQMAHAIRRLKDEFHGVFGPETVEQFTRATRLDLATRFSVPADLTFFIHHFTRERLTAIAQADGLIEGDRSEVLVVCVHDAGRSPMAAALAEAPSHGPPTS